jgi:hypothetical protein
VNEGPDLRRGHREGEDVVSLGPMRCAISVTGHNGYLVLSRIAIAPAGKQTCCKSPNPQNNTAAPGKSEQHSSDRGITLEPMHAID